MLHRRSLLSSVTIGAILASCTGGVIDPQKVADLLKTGCGIIVPLATITSVINAAVGASVQSVVDVICSSFKAHLAAAKLAAPAPGSKVAFDVTINGKTIPVEATTA